MSTGEGASWYAAGGGVRCVKNTKFSAKNVCVRGGGGYQKQKRFQHKRVCVCVCVCVGGIHSLLLRLPWCHLNWINIIHIKLSVQYICSAYTNLVERIVENFGYKTINHHNWYSHFFKKNYQIKDFSNSNLRRPWLSSRCLQHPLGSSLAELYGRRAPPRWFCGWRTTRWAWPYTGQPGWPSPGCPPYCIPDAEPAAASHAQTQGSGGRTRHVTKRGRGPVSGRLLVLKAKDC